MTEHLRRPIFWSLATRHADLALGGGRAKRFPPAINPFACSRDDAPESLAELAALADPGETLVFLQADPVVLPDSLVPTLEAEAVQMIETRPFAPVDDPEVVPLGRADAAEMLDLATITRPGPFTLEALRLGRFWGIRRAGRLVAMAGQRLALPGLTEVSGICSHPDVRGQGLARRLSLFVAGEIGATGERCFLHAYAANTPAVALYRSIGFEISNTMHVRFARRSEG